MKPHDQSQAGYSLLEVLVASMIFAIISGAVVGLLYQSQRAFRTQGDFNEAGVEARMALHHITQSLRYAGNDPREAFADAGVEALEILGPGNFRVNSDITGSIASTTENRKEKKGDPDGLLDSIYEVVEYRYDSDAKQLFVDVGYGETVLAKNIEGFDVDYFDRQGFETSSEADVCRVRIMLVAATETSDSSTGRKNLITLRSEVSLRTRAFDLYSLF